MKLGRNEILRLIPDVQAVELPDGRLLIRKPSGLSLLGGVALEGLQQVLGRIDGQKTVEELCNELAGDYEPADVLRLLQHLLGGVVVRQQHSAPTRPLADGLSLLGNGPAVEFLRDELQGRSGARPNSIEWGGAPDLEKHLAKTALLVCALEDVPCQILLEVQKTCWTAGRACLFLTRDPDGYRAGPSVVPGVGPCMACSLLASFQALNLPASELLPCLEKFRTLPWPRTPTVHSQQALQEVTSEVEAILSPQGQPTLLSRVRLFGPHPRTYPIQLHLQCPLCLSRDFRVNFAPFRGLPLKAALALETHTTPCIAPTESLVTSIGILGGGTAGYLAALALRKTHPQLKVTLIESSQIPVIGVGEATTPLMPQFLHVDLGLDIHEFFRALEPTFKLGIQFQWGGPDQGHFNYPFGTQQVLEAQLYDGHIRNCSLQSMLMSANRLPVYKDTEGNWISRLGRETAYHLDNRRFVAYLQQQTERSGVQHLDTRIADLELTSDGEEVRALISEDGTRFSFDFYLDCSGFRALLIDKLGSPFVSYADSLFTDCAVVATVPNQGLIRPHTVAQAMSAGWCWNTPMRDSDHRGYVFCSAFQDAESAAREMQQRNPGMGEWRLVRFQAGRRRHFWKGNVAALGNAYGFVEPLESTALHLLIRQIGMLLRAFPLRKGERGLAAVLNRRANDFWDYLRWFLALHYRFNRKMDTPFWRHCRESADVSSHAELIESFRERGPLSYDRSLSAFDYPDPLWGAQGIDLLLLGQEVGCRFPVSSQTKAGWLEQVQIWRKVVQQAAWQSEPLASLQERPYVLANFASEFRSAGPAYAGKLLATRS
ncbi:MAG: tryptophan halogenase family protein [Acidobacteriota bacterium]